MGKIGALALGLALGGASMVAEPVRGGRTLRIVRIADDPAQGGLFQPLRERLVVGLRAKGFDDVEIEVERPNTGTAKAFLAGRVDAVITSPAKAEMLRRLAPGGRLLIVADAADDGAIERYESVIFARRDGGVEALGDLPGKRIAFEDAASTIAFHMPHCTLTRSGLRLRKMESFRQPAPAGAVGYVFASAKLNLVSWVFHRKVEAGAVGIRTWRRMVETTPAFREQMRIVSQVPALPRTVMVLRAGLRPDDEAAVVEELSRLGGSAEGRAALKPLQWASVRAMKHHEVSQMSELFRGCGVTEGWR